jgi:4-amino-4-deoxy-L-arabinose transferase-like glycosyltransferase
MFGVFSRPIWYDEAFSLMLAQRGFAAFMAATLAPAASGLSDVHPPGYYFILIQWTKLFGASVVAGRLFSIMFGLLIVWLGYLVARKLFSDEIAKSAASLLALSPFLVHYAQEIRMYSLMTFGIVLCAFAYICKQEGDDRGRWLLAFAGGAALAQYTQALAAFYLVALALWPLFRQNWRMLRFVTSGGLLAIVLYSPWLAQLFSQVAMVERSWWVDQPGVVDLIATVLQWITFLPLPGFWLFFAVYVYLFLIVLWFFAWREGRLLNVEASAQWLVWMAFVPLILNFLISQWRSVFIFRAFLPSGVFFLLLVAWFIHRLIEKRYFKGLLAAFLGISMIAGLAGFYTYAGFPYAPFEEMINSIENQRQPDEIIVHANKLTILPALYFAPDVGQTYIRDKPGSPQDILTPSFKEALGLDERSDISDAVRNAQGVWFTIFERHIEEYRDQGFEHPPELDWLNRHYELIEATEWADMLVYHYYKP